MAQYEVSISALLEAEEQFLKLARELREALERLNAVRAKWQEGFEGLKGLEELRRQLACEIDAIDSALANVKDAARTLSEIREAYSHAERSAFAGAASPQALPRARGPEPRIVSRPVGRVMFGETIMPDWLQATVMRYEMSKDEQE